MCVCECVCVSVCVRVSCAIVVQSRSPPYLYHSFMGCHICVLYSLLKDATHTFTHFVGAEMIHTLFPWC